MINMNEVKQTLLYHKPVNHPVPPHHPLPVYLPVPPPPVNPPASAHASQQSSHTLQRFLYLLAAQDGGTGSHGTWREGRLQQSSKRPRTKYNNLGLMYFPLRTFVVQLLANRHNHTETYVGNFLWLVMYCTLYNTMDDCMWRVCAQLIYQIASSKILIAALVFRTEV